MQWDHVSPEFADVSLEADRQPPGAARVRAHEEALRLAQRDGSFAEEYVARSDLTSALYHVADTPDMLTHVAWLRSALAPEHGLEQAERDDVLWKLKWAVDKIEKMPEVPLDAWRAAVDDMEAAYRTDGYHLRPVHSARAWLAVAVDDPAARDAALAAWLETPRDGRSDCPACETRGQALLAAETDVRRALELLTPVTAGDLTCSHEPQVCLAHEAELRTVVGDLDGAAASFRRSWHLAGDDASLPVAVARCLRVLVRIGNTDRAVDLLLPRLRWLDDLHTAFDRMWFSATAAWVLHHGRRLGITPETVDGRPVVELQDALARTAEELAARFDARAGTDVTTRRLLAACDDSLVAAGPTLPPTHLGVVPEDAGATAPTPTTGAEVVALADRVLAGRRVLEPGIETALRGWQAARTDVLPRLESPAEWAAASLLDRVSVFLLRDLDAERARLTEALEAAERGQDPLAADHARADLAVVDVRGALADAGGEETPVVAEARARLAGLVDRFEADDHPETAADVLRWSALSTRPPDAEALLRHAADLYGSVGLPARRALCLLDAAPFAFPDGPDAVETLVAAAEEAAPGHDVVRAQALDVRARLARAMGDLDAAVTLHEQALDAAGRADGTRIQALFAFCDLLVDLSDWQRLEPRAADALALAARLRDPVALAVAQRHLGLAWVETGRPAEAAELLEAALPVIQEHIPLLVGPTAWALGNASAGVGSWAGARTAFAAASVGFEAAERIQEASHAQYRAGMSAWDAGDTEAAAAHLDDAADKARASGTVDVLLAALRSRAALRASTEDLDAGIADLDAVLGEVERFAASLTAEQGGEDEEFDAEIHEPDLLRQSGHLYARGGRPDEAVERLARAEALVGGDFELALRAEAGAVLADADRLEDAEPRLRASLDELRAAGLHDERVSAAQALARALDRAGRPDDAEAVWAAYGPEA